MRIVFIGILTIFFLSLVFKNSQELYSFKNFWNFLLHFTALSNKDREAEKQTDEYLKQLKDQKENLAYLKEQINNLRLGLNESPDVDQNGYFKGLLTKYQDEAYALNQQIAKLDDAYRDKMRNLSPKEAMPASRLIGQNQENFREQAQRMRDLMETNQMRAQMQMERLNDLMELNQMYLEALIERTNTLMEQRQNHAQNYLPLNH